MFFFNRNDPRYHSKSSTHGMSAHCAEYTFLEDLGINITGQCSN